MVNTAGGMAGGDRFALDVAAGPDARLVVTTAAAEKVYRALDDAGDRRRAAHGRARRRAGLAAAGNHSVRSRRAAAHASISISPTTRICCWRKRSSSAAPAWARRIDDMRAVDRWRVRRGGPADSMRKRCGSMARSPRDSPARPRPMATSRLRPCCVAPGDETAAAAVRALDAQFRGEVGVSAWKGVAVARALCRRRCRAPPRSRSGAGGAAIDAAAAALDQLSRIRKIVQTEFEGRR